MVREETALEALEAMLEAAALAPKDVLLPAPSALQNGQNSISATHMRVRLS